MLSDVIRYNKLLLHYYPKILNYSNESWLNNLKIHRKNYYADSAGGPSPSTEFNIFQISNSNFACGNFKLCHFDRPYPYLFSLNFKIILFFMCLIQNSHFFRHILKLL